MGILNQIYYVRPRDPSEDYVPQEGPEAKPFTKDIGDALVRGAPTSPETVSDDSSLQVRQN